MQCLLNILFFTGNVPSLFLKDVLILPYLGSDLQLSATDRSRGSGRNLHLEEHSFCLTVETGSSHNRDCKLQVPDHYSLCMHEAKLMKLGLQRNTGVARKMLHMPDSEEKATFG